MLSVIVIIIIVCFWHGDVMIVTALEHKVIIVYCTNSFSLQMVFVFPLTNCPSVILITVIVLQDIFRMSKDTFTFTYSLNHRQSFCSTDLYLIPVLTCILCSIFDHLKQLTSYIILTITVFVLSRYCMLKLNCFSIMIPYMSLIFPKVSACGGASN